MATTQVNELTEDTTPASADVVLTNDASDSNNAKKVQLSNLPKGFQAAAVADLSQTIAGPSIAEVQAISDKVDELLAALRAANLLAP